MVLNLTDYEWRVDIARSSGGSISNFKLEAHASHTIDLSGDDYLIKQTVLSEGAAKELSREIPARLEPGQTYRWRLVTLLSGTSGGADSR